MMDDDKAAANRAARMERKQAHLRALYDRHVGSFRALAGQDALTIARDAHVAIDEFLARDLGRSPGVEELLGCRVAELFARFKYALSPPEQIVLAATVRG